MTTQSHTHRTPRMPSQVQETQGRKAASNAPYTRQVETKLKSCMHKDKLPGKGECEMGIQQLDSERSQCDMRPIPTPVSPISSQMLRPVEESPELYTLPLQSQSPMEQWPHIGYNVTQTSQPLAQVDAYCIKKEPVTDATPPSALPHTPPPLPPFQQHKLTIRSPQKCD